MVNTIGNYHKTRIAPTPSGYLHLGNALSFALTAAIARKTGAKILLRIDDLDQNRVHPEYVQDIFDTLNFLGIDWDEGPRNAADYQQNWSQLHRMHLYRDALQQLAEQRDVFACRCSRSQLQQFESYPGTCRNRAIALDTPDVAWRLYTDDRQLTMQTLTEGTINTRLPNAMKDFVVKKKDDHPAYQLASVIDDMHFGVDLIVRGEDLYASTIAQLYLGDVLGLEDFKSKTFYHHPLMMDNGNKKLAKSAGSTSVRYLRAQGMTAKDVYNEISKTLSHNNVSENFGDFINF